MEQVERRCISDKFRTDDNAKGVGSITEKKEKKTKFMALDFYGVIGT